MFLNGIEVLAVTLAEGVATDHAVSFTQARDIDTFADENVISVRMGSSAISASESITFSKMICALRIVYD